MADLETLSRLSAAAVGRALHGGAVSPVALAEYLLDRIDAEASPVFLKSTPERALREARAAEARIADGRPASALDGVPVAWKDLVDMAGETTTAGSATRRGAAPADADAQIVANAAAAGMVSLGKVNLTEFAYSGLGLNPHFGTPACPRGRGAARIPGGSSSGSGVAVAAGLAPLAIGTDTGGSVRIPAAFNGVTGFKSSEGRIPSAGVFALSPTLDTVGPLGRSVEDCILGDMVLRGAVETPVRRRPVAALEILVPETVVLDDLDDAVAASFSASLARLEAAGARITRGSVPEFAETVGLAGAHGTIPAAEAWTEHKDLMESADAERVDPRVTARILMGRDMSACDLLIIQRARRRLCAALAARLEGAFIAMPTVAHTAPDLAALDVDRDLYNRMNLKTLRNTSIGNYLNLPGVAIPNGVDGEGLPTSFLLSSVGGDDERLLGAALGAEEVIRGEGAPSPVA